MPAWDVRCSVCGKVSEISAPVYPVGAPMPEHEMLDPAKRDTPCVGSNLPSLTIGEHK